MNEDAQKAERTVRRSAIWATVAVVVIGAVVAIRSGGNGDRSLSRTSGLVTVTYQVTGTARWADVTIETPTGSEQFSPDIPMRNERTGQYGIDLQFSVGDFVYISAQNNGVSGEVICTIRSSDGSVISQNTASSSYGIATCEGSAR